MDPQPHRILNNMHVRVSVCRYRNGEPVVTSLMDPQSHRILLDGDQRLFFLRIVHNKNSKKDVGTYYCNATNIHGSAISRNATLKLSGQLSVCLSVCWFVCLGFIIQYPFLHVHALELCI